mgnify:CR=1 FL=1
MLDKNDKAVRFSIFRHKDAPDDGIQIMESEPLSEVAMAGAQKVMAAGIEQGHENRVLFSGGGFSLVYAWFKSGYPLPRHTHNTDCLYYIIGGSLSIGSEELTEGDGFFVGKDVPYTYKVGENGLEILEFRASELFNIKVLANNAGFWDKAVATVNANKDQWLGETKPSKPPSA